MYRQLVRSRKHRMIGGVAGGLAEYFEIDPVIVRVLFIVATLGWGLSLVAYIILWIIVPDESKVEMDNYFNKKEPGDINSEPSIIEVESLEKKRSNRRLIGGIILICLGMVFLMDNFYAWIHWHNFWPLILIAFGAYILYKSRNNHIFREAK